MSPEDLVSNALLLDLEPSTAADLAAQCRQALASLPPEDSALAVKLSAACVLAEAEIHDCDTVCLATSAREMAERLGDEVALAHAQAAWVALHPTPAHLAERLTLARSIVEVADRHNEPTLSELGRYLLLVALLEGGQIRSLDLQLLNRDTIAMRFRCLRSILDGDVTLAEKQATELYEATRHSGADALSIFTTQMGIIGWMRGQIVDAEEGFLAARRAHPEQLLWSASLAWLWLAQGRRTAADALLRSMPALDEIPRNRYWLSTMTVLAQVASEHGDHDRAVELHRTLAPYADRLVPVGTGVAFWGTAARTIGLLEERLGMLDEARRHLELAVELTSRIGAQAWLAEAQIELAEFAIRHNLSDVPAYDLLAEARAASEARGFEALKNRAVHPARIRVFGRFEVTSPEGHVATWSSRKARELLKMLVAARGAATAREVLMDRLWPGEDPADLANRFSVAINTIRRALDPLKRYDRQHHVVIEGDSVRLNLNHLDIDLERFFRLAARGDDASRQAVEELYASGVFPDEPYADWAIEVRDDVRNARQAHRTSIRKKRS